MAFGYVVAFRNEDVEATESNEFHMALFVRSKLARITYASSTPPENNLFSSYTDKPVSQFASAVIIFHVRFGSCLGN